MTGTVELPFISRERLASAFAELVLVFVLFVLTNVTFAVTQPQTAIDGGRGWDGAQYYTVAQQIIAGERPTTEAPFVYRVGTSWLAARLSPGDLMLGFKAVNLAADLAIVLLLALFFRRYISDARVRLALVAAFVFMWHGPVRFFWFYPVASEHLAFAANLVVLLGASALRERIHVGALVSLSAVSFLATTVRETALLAPAALLFLRDPLRRALPARGQILLAVPLLAGLAAFAIVHSAATQTNGYGYLSALLDWLRVKSVFTYVLGWWNGYGPLLALPIFAWRGTLAFLRANQMLAAFLLACAVLGWVGGQDTERYVFWAAPVVYVLIGRAAIASAAWLSAPFVAGLVLAQALAERVAWPIPQPTVLDPLALLPPERPLRGDVLYVLTPLGNPDYFDLWSFWMPRVAKTIVLAEYAIVILAILGGLFVARLRAVRS